MDNESKDGLESTVISDTQSKENTNNENDTLVKEEATVNPASTELPLRTIPLNHQQNDGSVEMAYKEAIHLDSIDEDVVFEIVDSTGRGGGQRFVPNMDSDRPVKTYLPKKGEFVILPIGRNSDKASEGGIIGSLSVEVGTSFRFFSAKHKTQVTLVLVNGKNLVGYVVRSESKGARRCFYFPKNEAEKAITLPQKGKQIKLQVAKLLLG